MWLTFAPKRNWREALWCNGRSAERKNVIEQRAAKTGIIVATETMSRYFRQKNIYLARRLSSARTFHLRRPCLILALSLGPAIEDRFEMSRAFTALALHKFPPPEACMARLKS